MAGGGSEVSIHETTAIVFPKVLVVRCTAMMILDRGIGSEALETAPYWSRVIPNHESGALRGLYQD